MPHLKQTSNLLKQLRALMLDTKYVSEPINAYIVPSADAHNSEYLAECDQRRAFISGFTGSAGTAVITHNDACMWTDGRYYLQASQEMDSNWTLMKEGIPSTPTQGTWLSKNLPSGSRVGADPYLLSYNKWMPLKNQLESAGHKLIPITTNLIDLLWTDRKPMPSAEVKPLPNKYTGKTIQEKLKLVQQQMVDKNASYLVLTSLDEVAYFLNMRGNDISYNPVFFSYVLITQTGFTIFIDQNKVTKDVIDHLNVEAGVTIYDIKNYTEIANVLTNNAEKIEGFVWFSEQASYALTSLIPTKNLLTELTPISTMKAIKNPVEIEGMKNAHIKDGLALCCYFSWLEKNVHTRTISEISGAKKLREFRAQQELFVGPSFDTISSVGPHGAIIHYKPEPDTDVTIDPDGLYLCDSGGQYLDGTTDVTRTFHYGKPTEFEKDCYTRVLKGQIKMATMIFPQKIKGNCLDSFARQYLWSVGLDYAHGTGHGIGSYLNVHEGPMGISWKNIPDDPGLEAGMFLSNEPGFYQDGKFGFRIEDIVLIVNATTPNNFNNRGFLTFETVTLCPIQTKMIKTEMLTEEEIKHLNSYHQRCRDVLGPLLKQQGQTEAVEWLWKETEPINK
ncbi:xaa-Pro aminopeptidase ApepP [Onthophagus taurus]|uniref:xaa-Pro aminopeptidase ApepP n=1 Tax=Onthophagus taurus TaxID=166361 RepID=UPI000C209766|nr:xaa-Pro aminopeptidase ApepP [Onthophagus taurus]